MTKKTKSIWQYVISMAASSEDDLSDVTTYHQRKSVTSATDYVLLNVSDGPKTVLNLTSHGFHANTTAGDASRIGPVTIDGTSNSDFPSANDFTGKDSNGYWQTRIPGFLFRYDDSLKVEWQHGGTGQYVVTACMVLGSGPHSIAVVKDGEPVYMQAENIGEHQIENMDVPNGYKIVRDPNITHEDPQNKGMWDDSKEEVVDHPYWKPFYDALEDARVTSRQFGFREFMRNVNNPSDRGEIPFSTPDPSKGTYPPEESSDTPVNDAVRFLKEREDQRLPDRIG